MSAQTAWGLHLFTGRHGGPCATCGLHDGDGRAEHMECTCPYTDPSMWLSAASCGYGGGYEPGSMQEWDPDCPVHPPYATAR
jgi:hypothetical protein